MGNLHFSKIWIIGLVIAIAVAGVLTWQHVSKQKEIPEKALATFNNFMDSRTASGVRSDLYSYLPDTANILKLRVAKVWVTLSKVILTTPYLKRYEIAEAKEIGHNKFQFKVKSYLVQNGEDLGYYNESITMTQKNNKYIATGFEQSQYKLLSKVIPCRSASDESRIYGMYEFPSEKDFCYEALAVERKELSFCNRIQDKLSKNDCYVELAVIKEDPSICSAFKDDLWFSKKCYVSLASKTKDATVCDNLNEEIKKACLREAEYTAQQDELSEEFQTERDSLEKEYTGYEIKTVETVPEWNTYINQKYKYGIQYPKDFKVSADKSLVTFTLPLNNASVSIRLWQKPSVLLSGTYGGWYEFEEDSKPADMVLAYQMKLGNTLFNRTYWIAYGGMGGWDNVINCYMKQQNKYYIISLEHVFESAVPGTIGADGKKLAKQAIVDNALKKMLNQKDEYVQMFNKMLSTFKFLD